MALDKDIYQVSQAKKNLTFNFLRFKAHCIVYSCYDNVRQYSTTSKLLKFLRDFDRKTTWT